jgi:hypothetical protein
LGKFAITLLGGFRRGILIVWLWNNNLLVKIKDLFWNPMTKCMRFMMEIYWLNCMKFRKEGFSDTISNFFSNDIFQMISVFRFECKCCVCILFMNNQLSKTCWFPSKDLRT